MAGAGRAWSRGVVSVRRALARLGLVGISVEYRLVTPGSGTPFSTVSRTRSAVRYVRAHAARGHRPAEDHRQRRLRGRAPGERHRGVFDGVDEAGEDTKVSSTPCAMVLFFPVIDTSQAGYGNAKIGPAGRSFRPCTACSPVCRRPSFFTARATPSRLSQAEPSARRCSRPATAANWPCEGGTHGYLMRQCEEALAEDRSVPRFAGTAGEKGLRPMKIRYFFLALTAIVLLAAGAPAADVAPAKAAKTVRLLTVGNSFSQNATRFLPDLAAAGGHRLIHRPIVVGGASLQLHAEKALKHDDDANDSAGRYSSGHSLKQELAADRWDFVTIQQASLKSHDVNTYRPYARQLSDYIRKHAPSAALLMHETWAYRRDDPRFARSPAAGEPASQEAMYQGLAGAYRTIAAELGARLIPVGDAFHQADTDPEWGYRPDTKFDFQSAQPPALPDQTHSLHTGWRWAKQKDGKIVLGMDGHHANAAGEYLQGPRLLRSAVRRSVVGNSFVPPGVDAAYARFLQETAHQAVERARRSTKNRAGEVPLLDSRIIEQTDNAWPSAR